MLGLQELLYLFELCGELFVKVEDCKVEGVQGKEKMFWAEKVPVCASPLLPSGLLPLPPLVQ